MTAVLIALTGRWPDIREGVTLGTAVILLAVVFQVLGDMNAGVVETTVLVPMLPGLPLALAIEPLGMLFGLVASGLWIVNSIYSIGYMRGNN